MRRWAASDLAALGCRIIAAKERRARAARRAAGRAWRRAVVEALCRTDAEGIGEYTILNGHSETSGGEHE